MDTFDDLKKPFPLFQAPIVHAVLDGPGNCIRCNLHAGVRFHEACYACFRTDEIDAAIDTEFGMVTRDDALAARTHGIPLVDPSKISGYQLTPHPIDPRFPDDRWYHVHIDSEHLLELFRTPKYLARRKVAVLLPTSYGFPRLLAFRHLFLQPRSGIL